MTTCPKIRAYTSLMPQCWIKIFQQAHSTCCGYTIFTCGNPDSARRRVDYAKNCFTKNFLTDDSLDVPPLFAEWFYNNYNWVSRASIKSRITRYIFSFFLLYLILVSLVKKHGCNWDVGVPEMITKMRLRAELDEPVDGPPPVPPSTLTKKRLIHCFLCFGFFCNDNASSCRKAVSEADREAEKDFREATKEYKKAMRRYTTRLRRSTKILEEQKKKELLKKEWAKNYSPNYEYMMST
jgi:hypothetical protein